MQQFDKYLSLKKRLSALKEEILRSEIANDSYYLSKEYSDNLNELNRLESELKTYERQTCQPK